MAARTYSSLLLTLLLTIATVCGQDVALTPDVQYVDEGGDIDFTCQLPTALLGGKGEDLIFLKRQSADVDALFLGRGGFWVQSAYKERSVVTPIPSEEGHTLGYSVKISGAVPLDSAEYGCVKAVNMDYSGEPVYSKVFIKKQVQTLQMYAITTNGTEYPLENGESYQLTKKEDLRLMCRASGSVPAATVSAMLGMQDISEQLFTHSSEPVVIQEGDSHMKIYAYNTTLVSDNPIDIQVPQTVSCKAEVEGFEGSKTFTITTMFKHEPIIKCEDVVSRETAQDVALHCMLSADPALEKVFWVIRLPTGKNITLNDATTHSAYSSETENKGNFTSTKLFINQIFKNHFSNKYFVFAENAEGSTEMEAVLTEDPDTGEIGSVASTLAASALLFLTTAILRLL